MPFVFDCKPPLFPRHDYDTELAEQMGSHWAAFAPAGDPNHEGAPQWPRHAPQDSRWMELGPEVGPLPISRFRAYDISDAQRARLLAEVAGH